MSVRFWNFKDGGVLKCKIFVKESTCSKEIVLKQSCHELWFIKKSGNRTFKVNFLSQKLTNKFQKDIHLKLSI